MKKISHGEARLLISKAWDDEISAAEAKQLAHHLGDCSQCAPYADEMNRLLARIEGALSRRQSGAPEIPADERSED